MRKPPFLRPGLPVGLAAPSFGCATEPYKSLFESALQRFNHMGLPTIEGPNCRLSRGVGISNAPEECAAELMELMLSPMTQGVLSVAGGELMCEILPYLDFAALATAPPKWFMGYSDNTNFGFLYATLCETMSVYGPCAQSYGARELHPSLTDAMDLLCGRKNTFYGYGRWQRESLQTPDNPLEPYNLTEKTRYRIFNGDKDSALLTGRFLGGCGDILVNLAGTKYDNVGSFAGGDQKGIVWFIEFCDLDPMSMRRTLWSLREAGWFDSANGFIIGRPLHFDDEVLGVDRFGALEPILSLDVPVVADFDLGHLPPMMPFVNGAEGQLRCTADRAELRYFDF